MPRTICLLFLAALLIVACQDHLSPIPSSATPALPAIKTTFPVLTLTSTEFSPEEKQITQTVEPFPSLDLKPTITPSPTPGFGAAPPQEADQYQLVEWTDKELWDMILAEPPTFPADNTNPYYEQKDWPTVVLALNRELITRFPTSINYKEAFSRFVTPQDIGRWGWYGVNDRLGRFSQALQNTLNDPTTGFVLSQESFTKLSQLLAPYEELEVKQILPANNITGDGSPAWVIELRTSAYGGVVVLIGSGPGTYRVVSPQTDWFIFNWSDQEITVQDLNANGIPEIAVHYSHWGMGMTHYCAEEFHLFEWESGTFRDLTPHLETSANTDAGGCLKFEFNRGPNGTEAISTGNVITSDCSFGDFWRAGSFDIERVYEWNGSIFQLAKVQVRPLEKSMPEGQIINKCTLSWVNEAGASNGQASQILPSLLANKDQALVEGFKEQWGPAYRDYFNFKLATWYAMHGQRSQAVELLTEVRDHPIDTDFHAASELASAFLGAYPAVGAYAGCLATSNMLPFKDFPSNDFLYLDTKAMQNAWGFSDPLWSLGGCSTLFSGPIGREDPMNVCSLTDAFRLTIQGQFFGNSGSLSRWLTSQKIPFTGLTQVDLNHDGVQDWVVLLGTGQNQTYHLWALLQTGSGIKPIWLVDTQRHSANIPVAWNTYRPVPQNDPYIIYQWTDGIEIFQLTSKNGETIAEKAYEKVGYYDGGTFLGFTIQTDENGNGDHLMIPTSAENWIEIAWVPEANSLEIIKSPKIEEDQKISAAEKLLFDDREPDKAIEAIQQLLDSHLLEDSYSYKDPPRTRPYLQYLLGLANEMEGNEQNAVLAYWTLWDKYPMHPLSFIVQQKLNSSP
jgi:hypothetical protein